MTRSERRSSNLSAFLTLALAAAVLVQVAVVANDYALPWLKRTYRTMALPSMERNALGLLGGRGARFLAFIAANVPPDQPVVVPEGYGELSEQSILQFFLLPRGIPACSCRSLLTTGETTEACRACLLAEAHSIPAIGAFPPDSLVTPEKVFIPFEDSDYYRGLYVPPASTGNQGDLYIEMDTPIPLAIALDAAGLLLMGLLGLFLARCIGGELPWADLLAAAFPLGGGVLAWAVFLASWLGVRVTAALYLAWLLGMLLACLLLLRIRAERGGPAPLPPLQVRNRLAAGAQHPLRAAPLLLLALLSLAALAISIGRGYSVFDEIANWALKGYGIALEGTVYAGLKWGGHLISYPQNLHLQIAFFRLLDGDVLPGSKALFPLFALSMLAGCYSFWRKRQVEFVPAILGVLFVFSLPLFFEHSTQGWGNLPFSTYLVLSALFLTSGVVARRRGERWVGGTFLALGVWTRPEGVGYAVALSVLFVAASLILNRDRCLGWLLPALVVSSGWLLFSRTSLGGDEIGRTLASFFDALRSGNVKTDSIPFLLDYAAGQYRSTGAWGLLWVVAPLLFGLSLFRSKVWRASALFLTLSAGLIGLLIPLTLFYVASYSKADMATFLWASFNRAQFHGAILTFTAVLMAVAAQGEEGPPPQAQT